MSGAHDEPAATSRRVVLVGAAGVAAGLAGCGTGGGSSSPATTGTSAGPTDSGSDDLAAPIAAADVPVGGGKLFKDRNVVVTQPAAGQFKAFSATCTHQGCQVQTVTQGLINCPCHGSQYSIVDGSVQHPAPGLTKQTQRPLAAKTVTVSDGQLTIG